ncbi:TPA: hypothetical protein EYP44_03885 [Candidatus Bathyarchaeota archaeon]|nr:hypothetical protein [Candidatus Bathyarchaeota archaeon]
MLCRVSESSLRRRKRYLLIDVISDTPVPKHEFAKVIFDNLLRIYGEYGASRANLRLLGYGEEERMAIVCCSHDAVHMIRVVAASIDRIANQPVIARVLHVSGTLKSLKRKKSVAHLLQRPARR